MKSTLATQNLIDNSKIRKDFPILSRKVHGNDLIYFDNGASAQKPKKVLDAISSFYGQNYSNVHRGPNSLSEIATDQYERSRQKVAKFLKVTDSNQIIFTSNATAAINLVANCYGRSNISNNQTILISRLEHHANIVPWHILKDSYPDLNINISELTITDKLQIDFFDLEEKLRHNDVALVCITHVSNVTGLIVDISKVIYLAHKYGAKVLVDGSQAVMHDSVDVTKLDADFYVFTGHKIYAETGIGVLFAKSEFLEVMPPFMGGGGMISSVDIHKSKFCSHPAKFEAGTPPFVQAKSLEAAIEYLEELGLDKIHEFESSLKDYLIAKLSEVEEINILGHDSLSYSSIVSIIQDDIHPHDFASFLDSKGIEVRAGHHCAMPLMTKLGISGTLRLSLVFYNNFDEIDKTIEAIKQGVIFFKSN